jgi:SpoVK/Ycf46/Vps4 family AAA+-type ATPase
MAKRLNLTGPGTIHARYKSAQWLRVLSNNGIPLECSFFDCLGWATDGLSQTREVIRIGVEAKKMETGTRDQREAMNKMMKLQENEISEALEKLQYKHPDLEKLTRFVVDEQCEATMNAFADKKCKTYKKADAQMKEIFGLSEEACTLCEFVYLCQTFTPMEEYFEDQLELYKQNNHRMLGAMLGLSLKVVDRCIGEMADAGVMRDDHAMFRLNDGVAHYWDGREKEETAFCQRLEGKALPMDAFPFPAEDIEDIVDLMQQPDGTPVHLLFYGKPGTGKTAFAQSLAAQLKVDALSVLSRVHDDDSDRRASLIATVRMASKREGTFVLVDEAERLLDTDPAEGKDKAWLDRFLEKKGQRIVWITNKVDHIDEAVLRRFTRSLHFEELGIRERKSIWDRLVAEHGVASHLPEERRISFAETYDVPVAVIEKAIVQGKALCRKKDFAGVAGRVLDSHVTLIRHGLPGPRLIRPSQDYSLAGVSIKGNVDEIMARCRSLDTAMRQGGELRPMSGNMLFYGPPGTGKTALARYIAHELDRECIVVQASGLLDCYVGETEKNIDAAFRKAERNEAVLVFDEADSFIFTKDVARRSWESTQVNEFLTQLEDCRCLCICTTNRREALDKASMRRFAEKVEFVYAGPEQIEVLYDALLAPLASSPLSDGTRGAMCAMRQLTPGDFHAVRTRHCHDGPGTVDPDRLVQELRQAMGAKLEAEGRHVGF